MTEKLTGGCQYDAGLLWSPTHICTFDCVYCISKTGAYEYKKEKIRGVLDKAWIALNMGIPSLLRHLVIYKKAGRIMPIKIGRLIRALDATRNTFRINFAGGEPFLVPNFVEACAEITKRHFISINTNFVTGKVDEFSEKVDPKRVIVIIASLHIKELERRDLLSEYIKNFLKLQECGFPLLSKGVAYPAILGEVEKYKDFFKKKGIKIVFDPFVGSYNGQWYPEAYTDKEIDIFGLEPSCKSRTDSKRKICNAGYNIAVVFSDGSIYPCYQLKRYATGNIYKKIKFNDKLMACPFDVCKCSVDACDHYLYNKAMSGRKSDS